MQRSSFRQPLRWVPPFRGYLGGVAVVSPPQPPARGPARERRRTARVPCPRRCRAIRAASYPRAAARLRPRRLGRDRARDPPRDPSCLRVLPRRRCRVQVIATACPTTDPASPRTPSGADRPRVPVPRVPPRPARASAGGASWRRRCTFGSANPRGRRPRT